MQENTLPQPNKPPCDPLTNADPPAQFLTHDEQALFLASERERREEFEAGEHRSPFG